MKKQNGNGKANGNGQKAQTEEKTAGRAEPKTVAYNGYCIARSFHSKLAEAQAAHLAAKAADKDGNFRWSIYSITAPPKDAAIPEGMQASKNNGFAVAVGFDRSTVKATAMLKKAQAKGGKFIALQVLATKPHAKGTKQAKLAASR